MEIVCMPAITSVVFSLIEIFKKTIKNFTKREVFLRLIPILSIVCGAFVGLAFYYFMPDIMVGSNIVYALLVGGASGLSATGCNQIFKQLQKFGLNVTCEGCDESAENNDCAENNDIDESVENDCGEDNDCGESAENK